MVRGLIGAIAVVAALGVVEQSSDASLGETGPTACKAAQAYAPMLPGESLEVRAEPLPDARIVGTLSAPDGPQARLPGTTLRATVVTITASQSGWARIALQSAKDYRSLEPGQPFGWIPADLLAVDARVDGAITAYSHPGVLGEALATIGSDNVMFRVLGCRGSWLQVISVRTGNVWIDKWCANPHGGCRAGGSGG